MLGTPAENHWCRERAWALETFAAKLGRPGRQEENQESGVLETTGRNVSSGNE